jgi:hypothetical protein
MGFLGVLGTMIAAALVALRFRKVRDRLAEAAPESRELLDRYYPLRPKKTAAMSAPPSPGEA